jgi:uncharacterized protein YodC (DUF2158 family)
MDEKEFKIGDVVQLKSGGYKMTVEKIFNSNVECVWFGDGELNRGKFFKAILSKVYFVTTAK